MSVWFAHNEGGLECPFHDFENPQAGLLKGRF